MNNPLDFTSQLTDKHFTNITFRRQISLINRFYTGSLLHAGWGTGTTVSPLNLVTKQLQVKAKAECVQIETRYHLKPSQRGKAGAAERGGQMCSDRSALSLSSPEFCLYCAPADRMLNSFYWRGLRCNCVCVLGLLPCHFQVPPSVRVWGLGVEESPWLISLCALLGFEVISCFFKGPFREKWLPGADRAVTVSDSNRTKSE